MPPSPVTRTSEDNRTAALLNQVAAIVEGRGFWKISSLLFIGLIFLFFSYILEAPDRRPAIISFLFSSVGIAFLVTAAADFILLERASHSIGRQTEKSLADLRNDFSVLAHAIENGVTDVVSPRRMSEQHFITVVSNILTNTSGGVDIMGISLREFLDDAQPINRLIHDFKIHDKDVQIRLLLMDPFSRSAYIRSAVEQSLLVPYRDGKLYKDLDASTFGLSSELLTNKVGEKFTLSSRFYSCQVPFFMILTRDTLLMEPYHLGRSEDDPHCFGGFVPMIQYNSNSPMYQRATQHFKFVWDFVKSNRSFVDAGIDTRFWKEADIPWTRDLDEVLEHCRTFALGHGDI